MKKVILALILTLVLGLSLAGVVQAKNTDPAAEEVAAPIKSATYKDGSHQGSECPFSY